ncbi:unnamed protein product [Adineta ricciae]|uniref:Uncharacterized protein n=1 Tax=Adineta ricciae TaxID=249248 RepID=A0A815JTX6_ADIRI|nr:unnamed protein product [Adineta ricciae]CAF1522503.1 unnamed protein product [Adineta ricciae]
MTTIAATTASDATTKTYSTLRTDEIVYGIWNTSAGQDSIPSIPGCESDPPQAALGGSIRTEYTSHGFCTAGCPYSDKCGLATGFYLTFKSRPFVFKKFQIAMKKYSKARDPMRITIEGSSEHQFNLILGESWTLIYNSIPDLKVVGKRRTFGDVESVVDNVLPFASYRFLVVSKRGKETSASYSDGND